MKRARRTGAASRQMELKVQNKVFQLEVTVSAIEGALILARVEASARPIEDVAKSLAAALRIKPPRKRSVT